MKINKYNQFLKENNLNSVVEFLSGERVYWGDFLGKFEGKNFEEIMTSHQDWLTELREDFAESIKNCSMGSSYSGLCKSKDDPNKDFEQIQKELEDDCGWNFESIRNLFIEQVNTIVFQNFEEFINSYGLDNKNGLVDIYLYKLAEKLGHDPNIVELGGGGWCDYTTDKDEILIRYSYGYHHTKYGELMLKQAGISKERFIEESFNELKNIWISEICNGDFMEYISIERSELDDLFLVDDDRIIIYLNDLLKTIKEVRPELSLTREDLIAELVRIVDNYGLEMIDTGSDLVFSEKQVN